MTNLSRRSVAKGAAWSVPAVIVGAPAAMAANSCVKSQTVTENITLNNSRVWSDAPVPGAATAGKFQLQNNTQFALPPGFHYTITFHVFKNPGSTGIQSGYQSYVSTTNSSDRPLKFSTTPATNAYVGKDGIGGATLNEPLDPGESLNGTWSGSLIALDAEQATLNMRYNVSISTPTETYTYTDTKTDAAGCVVTTTHITTVNGGTWLYDNNGKGI